MSSLASQKKQKNYCCYCLVSLKNPNSTYFGSTNDMKRRLRQHNGEISGGARSTHKNRPWKLWYTVEGFGDDHRGALRFEWFCKFKHCKYILKGLRESNKVKRLFITFAAFKRVPHKLYIKTESRTLNQVIEKLGINEKNLIQI